MYGKLIIVLFLIGLIAPALADDELRVTTPAPRADDEVTRYAVVDFRVRGGIAGIDPQVNIKLLGLRSRTECAKDERGECKTFAVLYRGAKARTLINQLNTANLSTVSLRRRILNKVSTDCGSRPVYRGCSGLLEAGVLEGTPGLPTQTPTPTVTPTVG